ncbi:hypothetical protein ACP70R_033194 [Stipagrostis hirtigluma subsp. patula]
MERKNNLQSSAPQKASTTTESNAFTNPPQKAKRYFSYDLYVDTTLNLSLEDEVFQLDVFKLKNKFVVLAPRTDGKLFWDYSLIGHLIKKVSYPLTSETGKRVLLSLIKLVEQVLASGNCLARFDPSNVFLTHSGQVLLKHVRIVEPVYEARRHNIEDTLRVAKKLFEGCRVPPDIAHLLSLMEAQVKTNLYSIHGSLVPHFNRGWGFIQCYEQIKFKITVAEKNQILLKLPYINTWRSVIQCNLVLQETYDFVLGSYDPRPGSKSEIDQQLESAELFLEFLRNGHSHRMQRKLINVACQFDLIVLVLFPLLLPRLQEAILEVLKDRGLRLLQEIFRPLMLSD